MANTKKAATKKKTTAKAPAKKAAPKKKTTKKAVLQKQEPQAEKSIFQKKTIAERTVARKTRNWASLFGWVGIIFFSLLAVFLNFCMVGYSFSALVCACIVGIILVYKGLRLLSSKYPQDARSLKRVFTCILCIGLLVVGITEAIIIDASFGDPKEHCDYMVVLGAGVHGSEPSLSLQNRIDAAFDYLSAHPEVTAVLSGGQGPGEDITEARCMFDALVARGIDPDRLILEERSTSTAQNFHYSMPLLEERGFDSCGGRLAIVTNDFHMLRAKLLVGATWPLETVGVPAELPWWWLSANYYVREAFALIKTLIFD